MAYKLIWSPAARDDLHDIVIFIARNNPERAMSFGYQLIAATDQLQLFPEHGRIVPEHRNPDLREGVTDEMETAGAARPDIHPSCIRQSLPECQR